MQYIDEKFKDNEPKKTVENICNILSSLGISVKEVWHDSGVNNCYSLTVHADSGIPSSNGKGVTKDFARASAYGEFIERLQGGIYYYKYQSLTRNPGIDIQSFAPDAKYVSLDELIQDGEWMDYLIEAYPEYQLSRASIGEMCKAYSLTETDEILTIPFYSLFEKKYVYLPVNFVDHMYSTNGCCAGNTREEAWVHALSEMMERHASIKILLSGKAAPEIPKEVLMQYPTVSKILNQLLESGEYEVNIFDYSIGNGFPVVSTRIISKKDHGYRVNVAADPVFEIAVQRALTELFQGKNLDSVTKSHNGDVLAKVSDIAPVVNVINQLETGNGLYTAEYFANELTCTRDSAVFPDNSNLSNKQLLTYMLGLYKQLNKPLYVRNFSYLGFPSYRFVVPGFSEALAVRFGDLIPEYLIADEVSGTLRNAKNATTDELSWMLNYSNMISGVIGRYNVFSRISGIPLTGGNSMLCGITRAYAAYRLGMYQQAIGYINGCINALNIEDSEYFKCVNRYLTLKMSGVPDDQIKSILSKFFQCSYVQKLYGNLDSEKTPYDDYLIACDFKNCERCQYQQYCSFQKIKELNAKVGAIYREFVEGQAHSEFTI